jgi:hypothetical protein
MESDNSNGSLLKRLGYITEEEYCRTFGKSRHTAANERCAGRGPRYIKKGRTILYTEDAIQEWLQTGLSR